MPACTAFRCPHSIGGLTSILTLIRFWYCLEFLHKRKRNSVNHTCHVMNASKTNYKQHLLAVKRKRQQEVQCFYQNTCLWWKEIIALHQPKSLFWGPGCSGFPGDCRCKAVCCLCTSCRWQQERSVCLYSGAPQKILSWLFLGPHMMAHVAALYM